MAYVSVEEYCPYSSPAVIRKFPLVKPLIHYGFI